MKIPSSNQNLNSAHLKFLRAVATACRRSIIEMTTNAQSGHPGGSLSSIDFLALIYAFRLSQTGEPIVISNGHISPAVYAVLAEMGYLKKTEVLSGFRKFGTKFEGHVSRAVPGVWFGTGPLGAGVSAASGLAWAQKNKNSRVFAIVGDGEMQEGQVYEMMNTASKYKLNNFTVFLDYNQVQLSGGLKKIMPIQPAKIWAAAGWQVIQTNGHNYQKMWSAIRQAEKDKTRPSVIIGQTIMGQGVKMMAAAAQKHHATWHGKAPSADEAEIILRDLKLSPAEELELNLFRQKQIKWQPKKPNFPSLLSSLKIKTGSPVLYLPNEKMDCRTAYGNALLDLCQKNKNIVVLTADLSVSVMTTKVKEKIPDRHIDCGVAEQQMVSMAGGISLAEIVPFVSTFGAFMTSRAKDQARVNDINQTNVKMVATHCGLSVGEDGPTHQAIDDMGSMLGLLNTLVIEPADANHTDRIIRFVASHYGNVYVRMGRHKLPILTREDGTPFFDANYVYSYGACDKIRSEMDLTIVASGSVASEALRAVDQLKTERISAELIIASSPKQFTDTLWNSIQKTKRVLVVEDHNPHSGFGSQIARELILRRQNVLKFVNLGVDKYFGSGTASELYAAAGIDTAGIVEAAKNLF